jgi:excisionase family DNA binding protein
MAHVTLGEAARQTGRSKSQISRAIRAGQLSAERSAETASFRIEQSELQRWLDATNVIRATVLAGVEENPATGAQHAALEAQVERFKEAADLLRSQLADALSERNEWREAFKQQRALPPPQPAGETPQRWWRWLALTTLLAIVVTAAIVAATVLAISFALAERPADTVDRLAEPALTGAPRPRRAIGLIDADGCCVARIQDHGQARPTSCAPVPTPPSRRSPSA